MQVMHEAALSEAPGTASFQHVVTNPAYSGLLKRRYDRTHEDVVEIQVRLLGWTTSFRPTCPSGS